MLVWPNLLIASLDSNVGKKYLKIRLNKSFKQRRPIFLMAWIHIWKRDYVMKATFSRDEEHQWDVTQKSTVGKEAKLITKKLEGQRSSNMRPVEASLRIKSSIESAWIRFTRTTLPFAWTICRPIMQDLHSKPWKGIQTTSWLTDSSPLFTGVWAEGGTFKECIATTGLSIPPSRVDSKKALGVSCSLPMEDVTCRTVSSSGNSSNMNKLSVSISSVAAGVVGRLTGRSMGSHPSRDSKKPKGISMSSICETCARVGLFSLLWWRRHGGDRGGGDLWFPLQTPFSNALSLSGAVRISFPRLWNLRPGFYLLLQFLCGKGAFRKLNYRGNGDQWWLMDDFRRVIISLENGSENPHESYNRIVNRNESWVRELR